MIPYWLSLRKLFHNYIPGYFLLLGPGIFWSVLNASGQEYFQQEVNYCIHVTLDDSKHELNGYETVGYINNSPDTLSYLYFHLWPNAYSDNKTELARQLFKQNGNGKLFSDPELRGYIDSLDFKVDRQPVHLPDQSGRVAERRAAASATGRD